MKRRFWNPIRKALRRRGRQS